MHTYIHTYIHTHTHIYIYIYIRTYIHTHVYIYIYTHTYTRPHVHTYAHTHTRTPHTHTHTHTHTHPRTRQSSYHDETFLRQTSFLPTVTSCLAVLVTASWEQFWLGRAGPSWLPIRAVSGGKGKTCLQCFSIRFQGLLAGQDLLFVPKGLGQDLLALACSALLFVPKGLGQDLLAVFSHSVPRVACRASVVFLSRQSFRRVASLTRLFLPGSIARRMLGTELFLRLPG